MSEFREWSIKGGTPKPWFRGPQGTPGVPLGGNPPGYPYPLGMGIRDRDRGGPKWGPQGPREGPGEAPGGPREGPGRPPRGTPGVPREGTPGWGLNGGWGVPQPTVRGPQNPV